MGEVWRGTEWRGRVLFCEMRLGMVRSGRICLGGVRNGPVR